MFAGKNTIELGVKRVQIIFINESKFVCDFVESLCKFKDLACFCLSDTSDFAYLIDDLKPQLVVVDNNVYLGAEDLFWNGISSASHQTKTMIVGVESDRFDFSHPQAIDAENFANDIKSKLN